MTLAPAHARIPAISQRYRPFVSGQGYGAEVFREDDDFFAGEKDSA